MRAFLSQFEIGICELVVALASAHWSTDYDIVVRVVCAFIQIELVSRRNLAKQKSFGVGSQSERLQCLFCVRMYLLGCKIFFSGASVLRGFWSCATACKICARPFFDCRIKHCSSTHAVHLCMYSY